MANPHPKTDHLKPAWPKGVSGNPGGRPKSLRDRLGRSFEVKLAKQLAANALKGDKLALRLITERLWPALQRQEISGVDAQPIALQHAERIAESLDTDTLEALDRLASELGERVNESRGNGAAPGGNGSATH